MSKTVTVVACADREHDEPYLKRGFNAFRESCRKYGYEPLILGWGEKWGGLGTKPKLLKRAIESGRIETEHIIFADAFDVVFADSPAAVEHRWLYDFDYPCIVWNAELNCFPNAEYAKFHPSTGSPFKYLNSGLSIGKTADYLSALTQMRVEEWLDDYRKPDGSMYERNDQNDWMEKFLFGQCADDEPKMALDTDCFFFQTICSVPEDWIEGLENTFTQTKPQVFHFNGPAKTSPLFDRILTQLGY